MWYKPSTYTSHPVKRLVVFSLFQQTWYGRTLYKVRRYHFRGRNLLEVRS